MKHLVSILAAAILIAAAYIYQFGTPSLEELSHWSQSPAQLTGPSRKTTSSQQMDRSQKAGPTEASDQPPTANAPV